MHGETVKHNNHVHPNTRHEFFLSSCYVFLKRCLLSNQTLRTLVFYDTLQHHFDSPDWPSSGRYPIHNKDIKGERPLCTAVQIITILLQKQYSKVEINA